ncbi:MAG: hypothetical protein HN623_12490 [Bdellovibrionales bacterium]|jgi:hypothetical protein|nr:hypothetical protein [Bdellovibrionales bacterium]
MKSLKTKMQEFDRRWSITSSESAESIFGKFKTRILNVLGHIDKCLTPESISEFCQFYGIKEKWESSFYDSDHSSKNVINQLEIETNHINFYKLLEVIFALDMRSYSGCHKPALTGTPKTRHRVHHSSH